MVMIVRGEEVVLVMLRSVSVMVLVVVSGVGVL